MKENDEELSNNELNNNIKIILLGETGTGKTNLISVYLGNNFSNYSSTLSPTFSQKTLVVNDNKYFIDIWDTMGQEKYRTLTKNFIRGSQIVIFVYDITNKYSFDELNYWVNSVKEELSYKPVLGLAANKIDLFENETVSQKEGEEYAQKIGALFEETSAKENPDGFKNYVKNLIEKLLLEKNCIINGSDIATYKTLNKKVHKKDKKKKFC